MRTIATILILSLASACTAPERGSTYSYGAAVTSEGHAGLSVSVTSHTSNPGPATVWADFYTHNGDHVDTIESHTIRGDLGSVDWFDLVSERAPLSPEFSDGYARICVDVEISGVTDGPQFVGCTQ